MYYQCSENKGADQLHGYREADLRLCFHICKKPVFSRLGSFVFSPERKTKLLRMEDGRFRRAAVFDDDNDSDSDGSDMVSHMCVVCVGYIVFSNLSVIPQHCLVATGMSVFTFIVLPHCGIRQCSHS